MNFLNVMNAYRIKSKDVSFLLLLLHKLCKKINFSLYFQGKLNNPVIVIYNHKNETEIKFNSLKDAFVYVQPILLHRYRFNPKMTQRLHILFKSDLIHDVLNHFEEFYDFTQFYDEFKDDRVSIQFALRLLIEKGIAIKIIETEAYYYAELNNDVIYLSEYNNPFNSNEEFEDAVVQYWTSDSIEKDEFRNKFFFEYKDYGEILKSELGQVAEDIKDIGLEEFYLTMTELNYLVSEFICPEVKLAMDEVILKDCASDFILDATNHKEGYEAHVDYEEGFDKDLRDTLTYKEYCTQLSLGYGVSSFIQIARLYEDIHGNIWYDNDYVS